MGGGGGPNRQSALRRARAPTDMVRVLHVLPHAGSHVSGWYAEMLRQTFILVSNRPLGVSRMMEGGRNGYSVGSRMRPW